VYSEVPHSRGNTRSLFFLHWNPKYRYIWHRAKKGGEQLHCGSFFLKIHYYHYYSYFSFLSHLFHLFFSFFFFFLISTHEFYFVGFFPDYLPHLITPSRTGEWANGCVSLAADELNYNTYTHIFLETLVDIFQDKHSNFFIFMIIKKRQEFSQILFSFLSR